MTLWCPPLKHFDSTKLKNLPRGHQSAQESRCNEAVCWVERMGRQGWSERCLSLEEQQDYYLAHGSNVCTSLYIAQHPEEPCSRTETCGVCALELWLYWQRRRFIHAVFSSQRRVMGEEARAGHHTVHCTEKRWSTIICRLAEGQSDSAVVQDPVQN